ncbi:hypothetical protein ABEF93_005499 [Exophiala dermatitidis]
MDPSPAPKGLGDFGKLPPEIRVSIYKQCVNTCSADTLTRASRAIHDEVDFCQHDDFVLTFDINPRRLMSVVTCLNEEGTPWTAEPEKGVKYIDTRWHHTKDEDVHIPVPFEKLKAINIDIHSPNVHDPGQLVQGWHQVTRFLDWLLPDWTDSGRVPGGQHDIFPARTNTSLNLPKIHVRIVSTPSAGFQHSIVGPLRDVLMPNTDEPNQDEMDFEESDLAILLTPFRRMRRARSFTVELPAAISELQNQSLQNMIAELTTLACSREDFGLSWERDSAIMAEEHKWHTWLNYLLDDLDGPRAAQLRRCRLYVWCAGYEQMRMIQKDGIEDPMQDAAFGAGDVHFTPDQFDRLYRRDIHRYGAKTFLHPSSLATLKFYAEPNSTEQVVAFENFHPAGFPRTSSREFDELLEDAVRKMEAVTDRTGGQLHLVPWECYGCAQYRRHRRDRLIELEEQGYIEQAENEELALDQDTEMADVD